MHVLLKRKASFSAGHSYWKPELTLEENQALFGSFARAEGHGHNFTVEVAVEGAVDPVTGMVINITDVDRIVKSEVLVHLSDRFLNREVPFFLTHSPSLENLTAFVWDAVVGRLPARAELVGVTVLETPTLWADRVKRGSEMTTSLTRGYDFCAAHRLHSTQLTDAENREIFGKCNNSSGHGHNYEVEVTITGEPDERTGMLYDLDRLDRIVDEEILTPFDHRHLNFDIPEFAEVNPTSEMLTVVIWDRLAKKLETTGNPRLSKIVVRETARNSFEYSGGI